MGEFGWSGGNRASSTIAWKKHGPGNGQESIATTKHKLNAQPKYRPPVVFGNRERGEMYHPKFTTLEYTRSIRPGLGNGGVE